MDADRWLRIGGLFARATGLDPEERTALLDEECAQDDDLRAWVERLLRDDAATTGLVDRFDDLLPSDQRDPMVGRQLGTWRLTSRIATGGMGVVYRAERADGLFEQAVAVKLSRGDTCSDETRRRFDLERRTLASLSHSHIARLYDAGTTADGDPYFVMELVDGVPIDTFCDRQQLPISERIALFADICRAVHFAHQNLVVHRDLKPANILIDQQGVPKLLDFGIARLLDAEAGAEHTATRDRCLTPGYASPEQLHGGVVTTAADVYSLGVVLYRLLTGSGPFAGEAHSAADWERLVTGQPPTRPSTAVVRTAPTGTENQPTTRGPDPDSFAAGCRTTPGRLRHRLRGDLDRIILMALRKEPARRYSSAREFADDLQRHLTGQPVLAREDSLRYRTSRFVQRNRLAVGATLAVGAALVFGVVAARRGEERAVELARHAQSEAVSLDHVRRFLLDTFLASKDHWSEEQRRSARDHIGSHAERVHRQFADRPHLHANLLDSLGSVCLLLDLFEDAEGLMREALDLRLAEFGSASLEVALSLGNLGELHVRRQEYPEAIADLRTALALHRTCPPGIHTDVATAANDLAVALRIRGELDEAESLHREALALRRASGAVTLPVAETLNNLAGILLDRGGLEPARVMLEDALDLRRTILGDADALTLQSGSNLANALWRLDEVARARVLLEQAEAGYRALRAEGHEGLAQVLCSLGTLDMTAGQTEASESRLTEALRLQLALFGRSHPTVATTLSKLAVLYRYLGRSADASAAWSDVLVIRRAAFPADSPILGRTLQEYGVFLADSGARAKAEAALNEAITILEGAPAAHEATLARAELCLGMCVLRADRLQEAEALLVAGHDRMQRIEGVTAAEHEAVAGYFRALQLAQAARDG